MQRRKIDEKGKRPCRRKTDAYKASEERQQIQFKKIKIKNETLKQDIKWL